VAEQESSADQGTPVRDQVPPRTVVVAGDIVIDHHIYKGTRDKPHAPTEQGTAIHREAGGAKLLHGILETYVTSTDFHEAGKEFRVEFGMRPEPVGAAARFVESYSLLAPCRAGDSGKGSVWRIAANLGYGEDVKSGASYAPADSRSAAPASIVVLDDAALGFRSEKNEHAWPEEVRKGGPTGVEWVVLKTSAPVTLGDLWRHLCTTFCDRLVVVVSASDLRREEVSIAEGLSWERTAEDLLHELIFNNCIADLTKCRHLVVSLGVDGAVWCSRGDDGSVSYRLVFDPGGLERAWAQRVDGQVWGGMSCLVAAIVAEFVTHAPTEPDGPDIGAAIARGLSAMRRLLSAGHGPVESTGSPSRRGFPFAEVVAEIHQPSHRFSIAEVPAVVATEERPRDWSILSHGGTSRPLYGPARRVALFGPRALVDEVPYASFGKLLVVDRTEIESLRGLVRLIRGYESVQRQSKPLSVAVFGSPGSGKSFTVKQVAAEALGWTAPDRSTDKMPFLEFNLSQFTSPRDLMGAFHQVRDRVLEGATPVVFWDEFDTREYMWLQYLLAPMQDGAFRDGQVTHPIGKCVFMFAGGTSQDFENFGYRPDSPKYEAFRLAKGPDFVSRLSGYLNVAGPNKRQKYDTKKRRWIDDPTDLSFPVRRALLLRSAAGLPGLENRKELDIDSGLLAALLEVREYAHGARSLESIIGFVRTSGLPGLQRSELPPDDQLSLHVQCDEFKKLVERDRRFKMISELLAPAVHEFFLDLCRREGFPIKYDVPYDELPPDIKADNIAAAARIPRVLALVGLTVVAKHDSVKTPEATVRRIIRSNLELLAEAEHEGWMENKYRNGWSYSGVRDDANKLHPALVAYASLPPEDKAKDRDAVSNYPKIVKLAGFKIIQVE
jgi:hypothetical protein